MQMKAMSGLLLGILAGCATPLPAPVINHAAQTPCEYLAESRHRDLDDAAKLRELSAALEERYRTTSACMEERTKTVGGVLIYNLGFDCSSGKEETVFMQDRLNQLANYMQVNQQIERTIASGTVCDLANGKH